MTTRIMRQLAHDSSWPGLSRPSTPCLRRVKTWMPATSAGMTKAESSTRTPSLLPQGGGGVAGEAQGGGERGAARFHLPDPGIKGGAPLGRQLLQIGEGRIHVAARRARFDARQRRIG